jgi:hypothetical protein
MLSGKLTTNGESVDIANARMRGDEIQFIAGGLSYSGRVAGDSIEGTVMTPSGSRPFRATRNSR